MLFGAEPPRRAPAAGEPAPAAARYEVLRRLGAGGMGEVLAARDRSLRRVVAYKRLLPEASGRASVLGRFVAEAQITSQLDHPNVVPIYGLELNEDGSLAYAMKMIEGVELADLLRDASRAEAASAGGAAAPTSGAPPLDLSQRLEIFIKVCDAMSFAHSRGVLHRDLKPANVMVGRYGAVYVVDWGIARLMGARGGAHDPGDEGAEPATKDADDATRTRVGQALGTPAYMSPEQAQGRNDELDATSDVFTLGLILQEVVTLQRARAGAGVVEVLLAAAEGTRNPIVHIGGRRVAPELHAIIAKATALAPAERYASVEELAADVRRYLKGEAVSARRDTWLQRVGRWIAKNRTKALLVFVVAGVVVPLAGLVVGLVVHEARVEAMHLREERMTALTSDVAVRAAEIDAELHDYEAFAREAAGAMAALAPLDPERKARLGLEVARLAQEPIGADRLELLRVRDATGATVAAAGSGAAEPDASALAGAPTWRAAGEGDAVGVTHRVPLRAVANGATPAAIVGDVTIGIGARALHDALDLPAHEAVLESLLLRPDGVVSGRVAHAGAPRELGGVLADLTRRAAADSSGWFEATAAGQDLVIVWHRVASLGWSYVVVADRARLEAP